MRPRPTPLLADAGLALVLTALSLVTLADRDGPGVHWFGWVLAVLAVAPIAVRQRAPVLTMSAILAALTAYAALGYGEWPSAGLGMVVALFTVATLRPRRVAAAMCAATIAVLVLGRYAFDDPELTWALVVQGALVCLCAWALGEATRRWAQEAARAERSVAEERARIARELHDVVAHHMSVVTLQAGVAAYVLDTDREAARRAIAHADAAGREALTEMRRTVDALRTTEDEAPREPQPGLADLDALAERMRAAGVAVELRRTGRPRPLAQGLELCAFRAVQEALTNVLRHAGPKATARATVDWGDDVLRVEVADDGAGPRPGRPASGHGLRGMRERAALYGGVVHAGPGAHGGFVVRVSLPTEPLA